ncbi:hypothetical protein JIN84_10375 [Luteolibacter yonseiensis]|uniref:Addiction module protein n=1 Tax=Luteolibacter yonseiensis TaxID=1144680 RepID=A0A934R6G9_9BACT|nr:hypothetical protein [Luteolibacter yonseiensis]MBK1816019.1 hypothetical protein [Luteolibacter yonseiensis]
MEISENVLRLAREYSSLSEEERNEFASLVIPPDDREVGFEWRDEIDQRVREIDEGRVRLTEGDDFMRRFKAV